MAVGRPREHLVSVPEARSIPTSDLLNRQPGPRVLVWGFDGNDAFIKAVLGLAPTTQHVAGDTFLPEAAILDEWDCVVTNQVLVLPHFLSIVYVASPSNEKREIDRFVGGFHGRSGGVEQCPPARRSELYVPPELPDEVSQLVEATLLASSKANPAHVYFQLCHYGPSGMDFGASTWSVSPDPAETTSRIDLTLRPFLMDADGRILAARYERGPEAEAFLLPASCASPERWVAFALAELHRRCPQRYPLVGWRRSARWQTAPERELAVQLAEARAERSVTLRRQDERIHAIEHRLTREQDTADTGRRRLLTGTGDDLASEVSQTLQQLGFSVEIPDETLQPGTPRLEDLRLADASDPSWNAIGEVKGHTKGAQSSVFQRLARYAAHFTTSTGAAPVARWYVANHHRHQDPQSRPVVLAGGDSDIAEFANDGGLVIDTAVLFEAAEEVATGRLTPADLRQQMRAATGRFQLGEPNP